MRLQALHHLLVTAALGAALLAGGQALALQATAETDTATAGEPGPSAPGVAVAPRQGPPSPRIGPGQIQEIPRQYPVDQAMFGQMKAQANADADASTPVGDER